MEDDSSIFICNITVGVQVVEVVVMRGSVGSGVVLNELRFGGSEHIHGGERER